MKNWTKQLSDVIANALAEYAPALKGVSIAMLAVDLHPWHSYVGLAILTQTEVEEDKELLNPAELAAWQHCDFVDGLATWAIAKELEASMGADYGASEDAPATARKYFAAAATAVQSEDVASALEKFAKTDSFRLSVAHPDDGEEYCST